MPECILFSIFVVTFSLLKDFIRFCYFTQYSWEELELPHAYPILICPFATYLMVLFVLIKFLAKILPESCKTDKLIVTKEL